MTGAYNIEVLSKQHDRQAFDCGNAALHAYLKMHARQDMDRNIAVVYVLVPSSAPHKVAGFYSLSATAVRLDDWPDEVRKKLPRYPVVPATLIGRLAVCLEYRRRGFGAGLLLDALKRSLAASRDVGSVAVVVDAKDANGVAFYRQYGFMAFPAQEHRLFLAMKSIAPLYQLS